MTMVQPQMKVAYDTDAEGLSRAPLDAADIDVQVLSEWQWRVCDARRADNDALSLLGYIEKGDVGFEVLALGRGFQWFSFSTWREATDHFTGN